MERKSEKKEEPPGLARGGEGKRIKKKNGRLQELRKRDGKRERHSGKAQTAENSYLK